MKTRRPSWAPVVLALLVGIGGLAWGGTPALAATFVVPVSGTVDSPPEPVDLSGNVQVKSTTVPSGIPGVPPDVILSFRFLDVVGRGQSGTKYVARGEDILVRPLVASEFLEILMPFFPNTTGGFLSARSVLGSFTLTFDVTTGELTAATGSLSAPNF